MPKFLEDKLKKEYGAKSSIPYKVMNSIGAMHGNKETSKGAAMERKHEADQKMPNRKEHAPHNPGRIEHVHEHLQTARVAPHKGVDVHGNANTGHVAGNMPAHKHKPKLTHFYEK